MAPSPRGVARERQLGRDPEKAKPGEQAGDRRVDNGQMADDAYLN